MIIAYIIIGVLTFISGIIGFIIVIPWFKNEDQNVVVNTSVIAPSEGNPHIAFKHEHSMDFVNSSISGIVKGCRHESKYKKAANL